MRTTRTNMARLITILTITVTAIMIEGTSPILNNDRYPDCSVD